MACWLELSPKLSHVHGVFYVSIFFFERTRQTSHIVVITCQFMRRLNVCGGVDADFLNQKERVPCDKDVLIEKVFLEGPRCRGINLGV